MRDQKQLAKGRATILNVGLHMNDASLILAVDGELSDLDDLAAREHLRACWSCRTRKEQLERAIQEIVAHDRVMMSQLPNTAFDGSAAIFRARLDQLAEELGRPSWIRRWIFLLKPHASFGKIVQLALAAVVLVAALWQVAALSRKGVMTVSAAELLQRSIASEPQSAAGTAQPIAVQKLRIAVNGQSILRTIYRDGKLGRHAHSAMEDTLTDHVVRRQFDRTSFGWDDALSPKAYKDWWQQASSKKDSLTKLGGNLLKLETATQSGPVVRGSLTVRAADFHPIAEELVLPDNTDIEIAEVSYGVVDLSSLSPEIFGLNESVSLPLQPLVRPLLPDASQLAEAELRVLLALHSIGADLGEQITIQPTARHRVKVEGIAESEPRRQQIAAAIAGIDFLEFRVRSAQKVNPLPEEAAMSAPDQVVVATANSPLLNQQLEQRFPNANQRSEFVNRTVTLCETLTSRSWALKRLADRYTPQHTALLSADAQTQLQHLLEEQSNALSDATLALQTQLLPLIDASIVNAPPQGDFGSGSTADPLDDWRHRVNHLHLFAGAASEAALKLFVMSSQKEESPVQLQARLRSSLTRLQTDLSLLPLELHQHL